MASIHNPQRLAYLEGHSYVFKGALRVTSKLIGVGRSAQYKPNIKKDIDWMRCSLEARGVNILDANLDICLNPWHRESRVYELIDRYMKDDSLRSLFPSYYGTAKIPYESCPSQWRQEQSNKGNVLVTVLEPLRESRSSPDLYLSLSDEALAAAQDVSSELKDPEYAHIYIHLREIVDALHRLKIIHGDIKEDNIMHSVLFDFSKAWVYNGDLPYLEDFLKKKPRQFEDRRNGELRAIRILVFDDCKGEQALRRKFPALADCRRCQNVIERVITESNVATREDDLKGKGKVHVS